MMYIPNVLTANYSCPELKKQNTLKKDLLDYTDSGSLSMARRSAVLTHPITHRYIETGSRYTTGKWDI